MSLLLPTLATISRTIAAQPLLVALIVASVVASWATRRFQPRSPSMLFLSDLPPTLALLIVLDATVAQPAAPAGIRRAAVGPGGQEEGAHAVGERG